jgi:pimeloyl-ACP methyl ester carboxylesterase
MWMLMALALADTGAVRVVPVAPAESLAVAVAGSGPPVLLLPGLFGSRFGFRKVVPGLVADGFQAIVIEPLGVGASGRPAQADYSLTAQAARIGVALDSLGARNVIVVAHSVSGSIAFRLALLRPELVAAIVSLEGGPAEGASSPSFRTAMTFAPLLKLFGGKGIVRGKVHRQLKETAADSSWVTDSVVDGYTRDAVRDLSATLDAFGGMARSREPWALAPRLREVTIPVHLLLGAAPHKTGPRPDEVVLLRDSLPAFALDSVPGAGHFLAEERPDAVVVATRALAGKG